MNSKLIFFVFSFSILFIFSCSNEKKDVFEYINEISKDDCSENSDVFSAGIGILFSISFESASKFDTLLALESFEDFAYDQSKKYTEEEILNSKINFVPIENLKAGLSDVETYMWAATIGQLVHDMDDDNFDLEIFKNSFYLSINKEIDSLQRGNALNCMQFYLDHKENELKNKL